MSIQAVELLNKIWENNILKTDDDGELQVYCSKNPKSDLELRIRGVIFNNEKMIYKGFPFTEEIAVDDVEQLEKLNLDSLLKTWSYEGTMLKFIYYKDKWMCSTHRKLNAFQSRWSSRSSFGDMFKSAWSHYNEGDFESTFYTSLDTSKRYHFLLLSNADTRVVVKHQKEKLYLILVTNANDDPLWPLEKILNIPTSTFLEFNSIKEIVDAVESCNPFEKQGIIMYSRDFSIQYRILNSTYKKYQNVRNNISCLKYCYATVRNDEEKRNLFFELYPDASEIVKWFEARLGVIAAELFQVYKRRYIQKQYVIQSPERHTLLQAIHKRYLETKKRVTIDDIQFILNNWTFTGGLFKIVNKTDVLPK